MIELEIIKRADKAKGEGIAYLLICFDIFDYLRGDHDGGAYAVPCHSPAEVTAALATRQLGEDWTTKDPRDVCQHIIVLEHWQGQMDDPTACLDPKQWQQAENTR